MVNTQPDMERPCYSSLFFHDGGNSFSFPFLHSQREREKRTEYPTTQLYTQELQYVMRYQLLREFTFILPSETSQEEISFVTSSMVQERQPKVNSKGINNLYHASTKNLGSHPWLPINEASRSLFN